MKLNLKSHAKINLALNVTGKNKSLHKIESIISFIDLYDVISIKKIRAEKHNIFFPLSYTHLTLPTILRV